MNSSKKSFDRFLRFGVVATFCLVGYGILVWSGRALDQKVAMIKHENITSKWPNFRKSLNDTNCSAPQLRIVSRQNNNQSETRAAEKQSLRLSSVLDTCLDNGPLDVGSRVRAMQELRGRNFSEDDRRSALLFLAGKNLPTKMSKAATQWLADEILTTLRLQNPPWLNLANALGKVAFQADTDPVIRDYIVQHLGLYWETNGPQPEIDSALWRAVTSSVEMTPGTALIALSRGYQRDQQPQSLEKVRQQALTLAQNPATGLAVRVTALSIASEGQGAAVKTLANSLISNPATPVILRKVAERVLAP